MTIALIVFVVDKPLQDDSLQPRIKALEDKLDKSNADLEANVKQCNQVTFYC